MPVLALKEVENGEPCDILGGVIAGRAFFAHVRDAVDEALRVKRGHQAHRAQPEERRNTEG